MQITIELPDELAKSLGAGPEFSRRLLEAYAVEGYRTERLTRHQVGRLLELDRWRTEELLARHGATQAYTLADWALDRESLARAASR